MLISEAFKGYADDVIAFRNQSPKTEESHYVCMKRLLEFFGDVPVESLTFQMIRLWKKQLDARVSISTSREYIIRLRVVLIYLAQNGRPVIDVNLIAVPKRPERIPEFITKEEVSALIAEALRLRRGYPPVNRNRNAAIISLFYASGIRISELLSLNRSDIRDDGTFTVIGKGRKVRLCFTDQRTKDLIDQYLHYRHDGNQALFISNDNGQRIKAKNVQAIFRLLSKKMELTTPIHPHVLRHSYATNLLRNNCNIRYVQELLGHSSLETTQMYTHVVNEDLRAVYSEHHTV